MVTWLIDRPANPVTDITVVFAHGAGAGMDSDFMTAIANGLCDAGIGVVRFEFPYMAGRRLGGKKRPPDKMPVLLDSFSDVLLQQSGRCVAAGKSMGGRVASMLLAQRQCTAAISLGYPFHPPDKPEKCRNEHWDGIRDPWLIVQGTRDPFGTHDEVSQYNLPATARTVWLPDGDHDFKPRKISGFSQQQHWQSAIDACVNFLKEL